MRTARREEAEPSERLYAHAERRKTAPYFCTVGKKSERSVD